MKIRFNPLILGCFILGAVLLVLAALLTIGTGNPFHGAGHFICYLPGSAAGLDEGTAVCLNGVRVGQIEKVGVVYNGQRRHSIVRVTCQINADRLSDSTGNVIPLTENRTIQGLINDGLRAQIQTAGVVGAKFIDLSFYNVSEYPLQAGLPQSRFPTVPVVPSTMTEITQAASQIMGNLRKADFAAISRQVRDVLAAIDRQVGELQTNRLTDHLSDAAESVGRFTASSNMRETLVRFQTAATSLNALMTNLDAQVVPLSSKAGDALAESKTTLASLNETARNLQDFVGLRNQLGEQTRDLMQQLAQTARSIQQLADFLQQHPNALIAGRAQAAGNP